MKKKLFMLVCTVCVLVLTAGMAAAAVTFYFDAGGAKDRTLAANAPYYFPTEGYQTSSYNTFSVLSDNTRMFYKPDLSATGNVVFTLVNGVWLTPNVATDKYALYNSTTGAHVANAAVSMNTLTFAGVALVSGQYYYLKTSGGASDGNLRATTTNAATPTAMDLSVAQSGSYNTGSITGFVSFGYYWAFPVTTALDAVIDVTDSRHKFVGPATTDQLTITHGNNGFDYVTLLNDAVLPGALQIGGAVDPFASWTYRLACPDWTGVTGVVIDGAAATYDAVNGWYSVTDTTATHPLVGVGKNWVVTVDGTTALDVRDFTYTVMGTANIGYTSHTYVDCVTAGSWGINGAQFVAPHLISRDTWESYLVIKTTSAAPASEITADLLARNGSTKTVGPIAVPAGSAGGSLYLTASELLGLAGWPTGDVNYDFSAQLTFTIQQTQVYIDGFKYSSGSTYPVAVYEKKTYGGGATATQFIK